MPDDAQERIRVQRHNDYRQYHVLIQAIKRYEQFTYTMNVLFRSKYLKEEILEEAQKYTGDDFEKYLLWKKDESFREFLQKTSLIESATAHSCMVVRSHNHLTNTKTSQYKWLYHSLEEYLVELYNKGEDFVLYQTHLNDILLKREDEFEYIVPVLAQGEMLIRAMRDNPVRRDRYAEELYMMYTVLSNPDLYGNGKLFTDMKYRKKKPKEIWPLNSLKRVKYTPNRKPRTKR